MIDAQYEHLVSRVLRKGTPKSDRTGTGTLSVTGATLRYDLFNGFPLITTKKVNYRAIVGELLWFISGSTNTHDLNSKIWDAWADPQGDLGPIYGAQWARQLPDLEHTLKTNPTSRRMVVDAWQTSDLPDMALAPCHFAWQVVSDGSTVDLVVSQRSADVCIGVPFNIASYATLLHMLAHISGQKPGTLVWNGGDVHVYKNHTDGAQEQLSRTIQDLPTLRIIDRGQQTLRDFSVADFELLRYHPHDPIKLEVAV